MSIRETMSSGVSEHVPQRQQDPARNSSTYGRPTGETSAKSMTSHEHKIYLQRTDSGHLTAPHTPYPTDNVSSIEPVHSPNMSPNPSGIPTNLFQHQKSLAPSLASGSTSGTTSRPRLSQQWTHAATKQLDPRSPVVTLLPTTANPTEVLAQRFAAWRSVIRSILVYLTETVSIQDEIVRQQLRLSHAVNFPFFATENQHQPSTPEEKAIQKFFLPMGNGSVQDLPSILSQFHSQMANGALKMSKELANEVIPRLEDLRGDLLIKIKEIKTLHSDFKNSCSKELQQTKHDLKHFIEAVEAARYGAPKSDPYLIKISLEKQIKRQLNEENLLHEAFDNLQGSGRELEKVVVMEIQNALSIYARLLGQNAQIVFDVLISRLDVGFFNKEPVFEWDNFISKDPNFIEPNLPVRHMRDIVYKYQDDPLTYEVKSGFLERRSKFLKSYTKGFYLLTSSYLHEFKTPDRKRDLVPVMSLSLNDCTVAEHSKKGSSDYKFILHAKQNGIIHRGHNWVFRAESYESMLNWFEDLKKLTSTSSPIEKAKFVLSKSNIEANQRNHRRASSVKASNGPAPVTPGRRNSFGTPNLDNQTNTNTSVSIPETEPNGHIPNLRQPKTPQESGEHAFDGNIYIETTRDDGHYQAMKSNNSRTQTHH